MSPLGIFLVVQWLRICLRCERPRFDPWVGEIPWRREWLPTPVFLPGESHRQRSLMGYSPWGYKESDKTEWLTLLQCRGLGFDPWLRNKVSHAQEQLSWCARVVVACSWRSCATTRSPHAATKGSKWRNQDLMQPNKWVSTEKRCHLCTWLFLTTLSKIGHLL